MPPSNASRFDLAVQLYSGCARPPLPPPEAVVAIPARDEEERIEACLSALISQGGTSGDGGGPRLGIVLVVNNARDSTAERARSLLGAGSLPHLVLPVELPDGSANAGFARGLALDVGSLWAEERSGPGILLTTDADTRVGPDWIGRNRSGLTKEHSAVAGRFRFDPVEERLFPDHLRQRQRIEAAYDEALLALAARLDPVPHDPWPNHGTVSGASFALTLSAYRRIGGLPAVETGEDRALAAALAGHDIPIRHDPGIVVTTSARLRGRAAGGCAATLQMWCETRDAPGDERLEALPAALRRLVIRRHMRHAYSTGGDGAEWEARLGLPRGCLARSAVRGFGEAWARVNAQSPLLRPQPLRPGEMRAHLAAARDILATLDSASWGGEEIQPVIRSAELLDQTASLAQSLDEEFGGLIAG